MKKFRSHQESSRQQQSGEASGTTQNGAQEEDAKVESDGKSNRLQRRAAAKSPSANKSDTRNDKTSSDSTGLEATVSSQGGSPRVYAARRSGRVPTRKYTADGDIWCENLAVVEMPILAKSKTEQEPYQLQVRSYFQSQKTGDRVWDEPPSGASCIQYATDEVRKMAQLQMADLQITSHTPEGSSSTKKKTFGRHIHALLGRKGREETNPPPRRKISYKKGSASDVGTATRRPQREEQQLQMALIMSMNHGGNNGVANNNNNSASQKETLQDDEEDVAMAKALSISEAESHDATKRVDGRGERDLIKAVDSQEEERMLRAALKESEKEATAAGIIGKPKAAATRYQNHDNTNNRSEQRSRPISKKMEDDFEDCKLPPRTSPLGHSSPKRNSLVDGMSFGYDDNNSFHDHGASFVDDVGENRNMSPAAAYAEKRYEDSDDE